jgi:hypothetical protein
VRRFVLTVWRFLCTVLELAKRGPQIIGEGSQYPILERPPLLPSTVPKDTHEVLKAGFKMHGVELTGMDAFTTSTAAGAAASAPTAGGEDMLYCDAVGVIGGLRATSLRNFVRRTGLFRS